MRLIEVARRLQGVQTIQSVCSLLGVDRKKAVYLIHRLRKKGYVRTRTQSDKTRVYYVALEYRLKGVSYYDILNQHSPVKISAPVIYNVYGKQPTIEETIVFAIKTRSVRTILAALALFRKVTDWSALYKLGKENHIERQIGALHDLSRRVMRKVPKMSGRFRKFALPKEHYPFEYAVEGLRSRDFANIERVWKVYLPFNRKDLEAYK